MMLEDWCWYDMWYFKWLDPNSPSYCRNCNNRCPMQYACQRTYGLHCNYQVFSNLSKMTEEEVREWVDATLTWRDDPNNIRKGEYFWSMSCNGQGRHPKEE